MSVDICEVMAQVFCTGTITGYHLDVHIVYSSSAVTSIHQVHHMVVYISADLVDGKIKTFCREKDV